MSTIKTQTPGPEDNPVAPDAPMPTGLDHGLRGLIRENLFKDAKNSILTIVFGLIIGYVLYRASIFVFFNEKVTPDGGMRNSWDIISSQLIRYMVGTQFDGTNIGYPMLWAAI